MAMKIYTISRVKLIIRLHFEDTEIYTKMYMSMEYRIYYCQIQSKGK